MQMIRIDLLDDGTYRIDTIEGENKPVPGTMFMPAQIIRSQTCETPLQATEIVRTEIAALRSK